MTLDEWLKQQPKGTASRIARDAGTTRQTISHLRHGDVPSVTLALAIATVTGGAVSVSDWPTRDAPRTKRSRSAA